MPGHDGQKLVSETHVRDSKHCRIVITLEAMVEQQGMAKLPIYQRDATDYVKTLRDEFRELLEPLLEYLFDQHVTVDGLKVEAIK